MNVIGSHTTWRGPVASALLSVVGFVLPSGVAEAQSVVAQDAVIDSLGPRIGLGFTSGSSLPERLLAVRQAIDGARKTADARLLGQAQGLIGADWDNPRASAETKLLQATIQQHRHEFSDALTSLKSVLSQPDLHLAVAQQAWLTVAVIERVQGHYAAAWQACQRLTGHLVAVYKSACIAETQSLRGESAAATKAFEGLLRQPLTLQQQAWVRSLLAEHEVRQGKTVQAAKNFAASLVREPDHYTAIAYSDLLLATQQAKAALDVLMGQPDSDAALVRRAIALRSLNLPAATRTSHEVQQRFDDQARREPGRRSHLREQALYQLRVRGNAKLALALAQENLGLQREPTDWLIAVQSARSAGQPAVVTALLAAARQQGLRDARLNP